MYSNILLVIFGATILFQFGWAQNQNFITIGSLDKCKGKDSGNYTLITEQESDSNCTTDSVKPTLRLLIENGPNGEKRVMTLTALAGARFPAGANVVEGGLTLFNNGPLAGKYGFFRGTHLVVNYLKKCSSVLSLSIIKWSNAELMISDILVQEVLISSTGAYEAFKNVATTSCTGILYTV